MSSDFTFCNLKEYGPDNYNAKFNKICVCCSSQNEILLNIKTCKHKTFLERNNKFKIDISNGYVCIFCHNMLKKIELFRQQVEENIGFLSDQADILKLTKLNNLQYSTPHITDSTEPEIPEFDIKSETDDVEAFDHEIQTEIKVEHDSSDYETDVPLTAIKKRKREKQVTKYEGKIRIVTLTLEELKEERENLAKQEKYLSLPYKCEHCIKGFDHEITWRSHMETRHKKSKSSFQCDICKSVLGSKHTYNEHRKRHERRLECMECGKRYNHEQSAIQHYDEQHLPAGSSLQRGYTCRECGFTTTVNRTYRYHLDKHKQKQECNLCGNTFVNAYSLKMHMYTVHKQSSRVYRCEPCDKTYRAKSGLLSHFRTTHADAPKAYCALCRTHYMTEHALKTHLSTHSKHVSETDKRYICDECGAKFVKKYSLQIHINWEHLKLNTHRCLKCSKVFKTAKALLRHVNYVHNKLRPPRNKICHFCGRGFTTQNILQSHLRTHTGERPLQCQHCRATFAHSGALYTHIKLKHNGLDK